MPEPTCLALVLCDLVLEDPRTRNKTLVNCFTALSVPLIPSLHPRAYAFATVAHLSEPVDVRLIVWDPQDRVLMQVDGRIEDVDPNQTYDLVVEILNLQMSAHGTYAVELVVAGRSLLTRRFAVLPPQMATPAQPA